MTFFNFTPAMETSVQKMDEEHKVIIQLMNKLYDQNQKKSPKPELLKTLNELKDWTVKHFADEEEFMESIGYEKLTTHKAIHKKLLTDFVKHYENFQKPQSLTLHADFFEFLSVWLSAHIQHIDMQYSPKAVKKSA